jgi:methyl-accepting chemotaxis protein
MSGEETGGDGGPLDFIRKRYARKFAIIGLLIILFVIGIGVVTQGQVSERLTDEKVDTVQTNAQLEAQSFGAWLAGEKRQVRTLSNHRSLQSDDQGEIRSGLNQELSSMSAEVEMVHYVENEPDGEILVSTESSYEGNGLSSTQIRWNDPDEYPTDQLSNDNTVFESFVYKEGDKPSVALVSPVPGTDNMIVSIIRTNVRAEQFSSSIEGTRTVVIGGFTGLNLFSENRQEVLTSYGGGEVPENASDANTEVERRIIDSNVENNGALVNNQNVIGYASVPGTDWVVVKEAPKSEALALQEDVRQSLILLIGGSLVGIILLTAVTALGPMRSLRGLATEGQAIAAGDLSIDIEDDDRIDEVGQVRSSFQSIKSYIDTAAGQTDAIARQDFDAEILDEEVPGPLGESLQSTKDDLEESISEMESARKQAEVAQAEAEQLANYLKEQAQEYSEVMQKVGAGDLTQRMEADGQEESMDRIAEEFNDMIVELEKTTGQLQSYVDEVEQAGEEVEHSADTVREASEQVANSIQKISDDAYGQKERLQNLAEMMDGLVTDFEAVADNPDVDIDDELDDVRGLSTEINDVVELTDEMMAESEQVAGAAEEQAAELNQVHERADDLQSYAEPLRDILEAFETDQEHEFVFSVGPTGGNASPGEKE